MADDPTADFLGHVGIGQGGRERMAERVEAPGVLRSLASLGAFPDVSPVNLRMFHDGDEHGGKAMPAPHMRFDQGREKRLGIGAGVAAFQP